MRGILATVLLCAAPAIAQSPIGLVVSAREARLQCAGSLLPLDALAGDLLFEGDTIMAGGSAVSAVHCPGAQR